MDEDRPRTDGIDDHDDLVLCPGCNAQVYAEAPQCPGCGRWFMREDRLEMVWEPPRPRWMKIVAVALLAVMALGCAAALVVTFLV